MPASPQPPSGTPQGDSHDGIAAVPAPMSDPVADLVPGLDPKIVGLAHEMKNATTALRQLSALALPMAPEGELAAILRLIGATATHLDVLSNNVLDGAGRDLPRLNIAPVDLGAALGFVVDLHRPLLTGRQRFSCDIAADLPETIATDPIRLNQILINLVGNALRVCTEGTIALAARRDGERVRITVEDDGPGLPQGFDLPAYLAEKGHAADGHGLGLAISAGLAGALGGELTLRNRSGAGSDTRPESGPGACATLDLPLHGRPAQPAKNDPAKNYQDSDYQDRDYPAGDDTPLRLAPCLDQPPMAHALAGKSVLVIDDNPVNRCLLVAMLASFDLDVTSVASGPEAVIAVHRRRPDIVLVDRHLVGETGDEVLARLTETLRGDLPVAISVSATDEPASKPFRGALHRPFSPRRLFTCLEQAIA